MKYFVRLIAVMLVGLVFVSGSAFQKGENPLDCLEDSGDGAITWSMNESGRWAYAGASDVPVLEGVHGQWYGYDNGEGWQGAFGWPNDMYPYRKTVLYRYDQETAQLWFYKSPTEPDLTVLFVYESMAKWADSSGNHYGEHDFCWWGEVIHESE